MGPSKCARGLELKVCLLDAYVVIDTSCLPLILRAAFQCVTGLSDFRSGVGNEAAFFRSVEELLGRLSACSRDNVLLTTTFAYEQMRPDRPGWILHDKPYLEELHASEPHSSQLEQVLSRRIRNLPVGPEDVGALERRLREGEYDIGSVDVGVILLGLRLAREGNVFIVSDDQSMLDAVQWLQLRERVTIGDETYESHELIGLQLLQVARSVHGCCVLDSTSYHEVLAAYHAHMRDRQDEGPLSEEVMRRHARTMAQVTEAIFMECDAKGRLQQEAEVTAEMERHFLGESQE